MTRRLVEFQNIRFSFLSTNQLELLKCIWKVEPNSVFYTRITILRASRSVIFRTASCAKTSASENTLRNRMHHAILCIMRESNQLERRRKGSTGQEPRKWTIYHESMTTTSKRSAPLKNTCLHSLTRNCCSNAIDHHVPNEHMNLSPKSRFDHLY